MDAFDDVRNCAAALSRTLSEDSSLHFASSRIRHSVHYVFSRAESLMRKTGRADISDGYARLLNIEFDRLLRDRDERAKSNGFVMSLLDILENEVALAVSDLKYAVVEASINGRLIALRLAWSLLDTTCS